MGFFSTFGVVFCVVMGLFFVLILLLRFAKYGSILGSLAATFAGGIPIIDKAGMGDIAECTGHVQHPITKKIRLRLNYIDKFSEGQTPYIFDEDDFYPPLSMIDWSHYAGTIICFKDFEGRRDFREVSTLAITDQNKKLRRQIQIYKRAGVSLLEHFEGQKVEEAKEGKNLYNAKVYKAIKTLVEEQNVDTVEPNENDSMFD